MDNNTYGELEKKLESLGVDISRDALYEKGTKRKRKDLKAIFDLYKTTESEFLAETSRRIDAKAKESAQKAAQGPHAYESRYSVTKVEDPGLFGIKPWSSVDSKVFAKIKFAVNPIDRSIVLCVNISGDEWRSLPISTSSVKADIIALGQLTSMAESITGKYKNYYDELQDATTKPLEVAVKMYETRKLASWDDFIGFVKGHIPNSMLAKAYLKILLKQVETTFIDPSTGKEKTTVVSVPKSAVLAQGDGTVQYDVIRHIVENSGLIASQPEAIIEMPCVISNTLGVPTFRYIDLDKIYKHGPHKYWDEYFSRYLPEEAAVFRAFIWCIFKADNKGRQLLYLYDPDGFSGKTVVMKAIAHCLGKSLVASLQKDSMINQFGLAKVYDKRLVVIGDNKNPYLIKSEKMHMLLGGDDAEIEHKGKNSFTTTLQSKVIASGNTALKIDVSARHERTRVIVLKPKMKKDTIKKIVALDKNGEPMKDSFGEYQWLGDSTFEKKLIEEFPYMLEDAKKDYERLCPSDCNIILPESIIASIQATMDDSLCIMDEIFERVFELDPDSWMKVSDLKDAVNDDLERQDISFDDFAAHIIKAYKVEKKYHPDARKEGHHHPVYVGLHCKS